jgi:Flp pilus assembly protein TadB
MTESEIQTILMKANGCVESECAISDVDDLISELKDQQRVLNARLETIMNVVAHLQTANSKVGDNRKTDDVRNIVKDMLRVFTTVVSFSLFLLLALLYIWFCYCFLFVMCHKYKNVQNRTMVCLFVDHIPLSTLFSFLCFFTSVFRMISLPWVSVVILVMVHPLRMTLFHRNHGRRLPRLNRDMPKEIFLSVNPLSPSGS